LLEGLQKEWRKEERGKKGERSRGRGERKGKREVYKVGFWNVAGLENKDRDFWERLKKWNVFE